MSRSGCLCACVCLLSIITPLSAQEDDFGLWGFVGVNKKVSKVFSVYGEAEMRTRDDVTKIDCWALYGEVSVRLCPYLKAGVGYTYIDYNSDELSWESRHRINAFVTGSYSVGVWSFAVRERYEEVHRVLADESRPTPAPKRTLRSRAECSCKIPHSLFSPYATVELYTTLNSSEGVMNDKLRYTIGTQIRIGEDHAVSLYYRYIDQAYGSHNSHILGVGIRFNL